MRKGVTIWEPSNVYDSAILGEGVSVGAFAEIGPNVKIGDRTRVGKGCFIPEGVTVQEDCFIAPHVCFTNDLYPPSGKENWKPTLVKKGASIGANATIICGVTIGEHAFVAAGAVVTKDVPDGEMCMGVPALVKGERKYA
jgi:acetyltransferase-like isoleucine patch superfamily enzyme